MDNIVWKVILTIIQVTPPTHSPTMDWSPPTHLKFPNDHSISDLSGNCMRITLITYFLSVKTFILTTWGVQELSNICQTPCSVRFNKSLFLLWLSWAGPTWLFYINATNQFQVFFGRIWREILCLLLLTSSLFQFSAVFFLLSCHDWEWLGTLSTMPPKQLIAPLSNRIFYILTTKVVKAELNFRWKKVELQN